MPSASHRSKGTTRTAAASLTLLGLVLAAGCTGPDAEEVAGIYEVVHYDRYGVCDRPPSPLGPERNVLHLDARGINGVEVTRCTTEGDCTWPDRLSPWGGGVWRDESESATETFWGCDVDYRMAELVAYDGDEVTLQIVKREGSSWRSGDDCRPTAYPDRLDCELFTEITAVRAQPNSPR